MTKKLTHWLLTIIAMALTFVMLCGTLGAFRGMSASAAEAAPAPSGWYVMGNGAGEQGLKNCSWTEFKKDFRLEGVATDDVNYLGSWYTNKLALYQNDQFKLLYSDGTLVGPTAEDSWAAKNVADYYTISKETRFNFICGVYGNIRIAEGFEGWYTFYLDVYEVNGEVQKSLTYTYDDKTPLPSIEMHYEMYVVGSIASDTNVGWPGQTDKTMIEMFPREIEVENEEGEIVTVTKYYSHQIYFHTTDEIKVYNAIDNNYYPDGLDNAVVPTADGWFVVEWEETAPNFEFRACDENGAPYWPELDGWYIVGNGAGTLYDCSWTKYLSDYRLGGVAFDGSSEKDYLGFWKTQSLLLYQGDQFKFLYQNGRWATPDASGWQSSYTAGFSDLSANNSGNAFSSVGEDIIQVNKSGYYTFYIHVAKSTGGVAITLTFNLTSTNVPSKTLEDMYIVGSVASVPACGWPDNVDVTSNCIKMTRSAYDEKWYSPAIRLTAADEIKVYNLANHGYYPSFFDDNFSVATSGWYIIQWESGSQTLTAIPVPNNFAS